MIPLLALTLLAQDASTYFNSIQQLNPLNGDWSKAITAEGYDGRLFMASSSDATNGIGILRLPVIKPYTLSFQGDDYKPLFQITFESSESYGHALSKETIWTFYIEGKSYELTGSQIAEFAKKHGAEKATEPPSK